MLKIGVVGAGGHARDHHLPALERYRAENPGTIELRALCEIDAERRAAAGAQWGFAECYASLDEMLDRASLDLLMLLTPEKVTWPLTRQALKSRIPLLIEKPPGANVEEARMLSEAVCASGVQAMVSVNRRFDPIVAEGMRWIDGRTPTFIRATFARSNRREPGFLTDTAIHACDTVRFLAGERGILETRSTPAADGRWRFAQVLFEGGVIAQLEIMPTSGANAERYDVIGEGFTVTMQSPFFDAGELHCFDAGKLVHEFSVSRDEPQFVRSGTYAETCVMLDDLRAGRRLAPGPERVVGSVELAWRVAAAG